MTGPSPTYPNPSSHHREIVCTAGVDLETRELIRLFPIPFRMLAQANRFHKWQVVELDVRKASDSRRESYEVRDGSIEVGEQIEPTPAGWKRRWSYVEHLISPSLADIDSKPNEARPSLGIIKPTNVTLSIVPHRNPEFTPREKRKLMGDRGHDTLFSDYKHLRLLEKIPWKFQYRFDYDDKGQRKYVAFFEDWEVGEAFRNFRDLYKGDLEKTKAAIENNFLRRPLEKDNLYLAVGTHSRFRHQWLAIGILMPQLNHRSTAEQLSLLDM